MLKMWNPSIKEEEEEFRLRQKREKLRLQMEQSKIDAENGLMSASNSQLGGAAAAKYKIDFPQGGTATAEVDTCHPLGGVSSRHKIPNAVIPSLDVTRVVSTPNQTSSDILVAGTHHPASDIGKTTYLCRVPPPGDTTQVLSSLHSPLISDTVITSGSTSVVLVNIIHQGQQQQCQLLNAIQIPKVEISVFDGDPMKYWLFIRTFENNVEKDTIDSCAKLARLLQYTTGKALKVIQSCAIMNPDDGYRRAKELLRERFRNPYTITETWNGHVTPPISLGPMLSTLSTI